MMDPELDDPDVWTYGTVLKNPGCNFVVMYVGSDRPYPYNDFKALVLHDGVSGREGMGSRQNEFTVCGGRPDDERGIRWVVLP
jgi:hypothetical protein